MGQKEYVKSIFRNSDQNKQGKAAIHTVIRRELSLGLSWLSSREQLELYKEIQNAF